jgi:hypothetical protein
MMDNKEFRQITQTVFKANGFEKLKNRYYRKGQGFLCELQIQNSGYGSMAYVNFDFFLGEFEKPYIINRESGSTYTPFVGGRFYFGEKYGYSCEYPKWSEDQLFHALLENMNSAILPPFDLGKQYLRDHYGTLYRATLNIQESEKLLFSE